MVQKTSPTTPIGEGLATRLPLCSASGADLNDGVNDVLGAALHPDRPGQVERPS